MRDYEGEIVGIGPNPFEDMELFPASDHERFVAEVEREVAAMTDAQLLETIARGERASEEFIFEEKALRHVIAMREAGLHVTPEVLRGERIDERQFRDDYAKGVARMSSEELEAALADVRAQGSKIALRTVRARRESDRRVRRNGRQGATVTPAAVATLEGQVTALTRELAELRTRHAALRADYADMVRDQQVDRAGKEVAEQSLAVAQQREGELEGQVRAFRTELDAARKLAERQAAQLQELASEKQRSIEALQLAQRAQLRSVVDVEVQARATTERELVTARLRNAVADELVAAGVVGVHYAEARDEILATLLREHQLDAPAHVGEAREHVRAYVEVHPACIVPVTPTSAPASPAAAEVWDAEPALATERDEEPPHQDDGDVPPGADASREQPPPPDAGPVPAQAQLEPVVDAPSAAALEQLEARATEELLGSVRSAIEEIEGLGVMESGWGEEKYAWYERTLRHGEGGSAINLREILAWAYEIPDLARSIASVESFRAALEGEPLGRWILASPVKRRAAALSSIARELHGLDLEERALAEEDAQLARVAGAERQLIEHALGGDLPADVGGALPEGAPDRLRACMLAITDARERVRRDEADARAAALARGIRAALVRKLGERRAARATTRDRKLLAREEQRLADTIESIVGAWAERRRKIAQRRGTISNERSACADRERALHTADAPAWTNEIANELSQKITQRISGMASAIERTFAHLIAAHGLKHPSGTTVPTQDIEHVVQVIQLVRACQQGGAPASTGPPESVLSGLSEYQRRKVTDASHFAGIVRDAQGITRRLDEEEQTLRARANGMSTAELSEKYVAITTRRKELTEAKKKLSNIRDDVASMLEQALEFAVQRTSENALRSLWPQILTTYGLDEGRLRTLQATAEAVEVISCGAQLLDSAYLEDVRSMLNSHETMEVDIHVTHYLSRKLHLRSGKGYTDLRALCAAGLCAVVFVGEEGDRTRGQFVRIPNIEEICTVLRSADIPASPIAPEELVALLSKRIAWRSLQMEYSNPRGYRETLTVRGCVLLTENTLMGTDTIEF